MHLHNICSDMLEIMQTFGSEVSDTIMPPRKLNIQKASVIRQFRRWNPNFLKFFYFKDGKWHPKLGKEAELERRKVMRKKQGIKFAKNNYLLHSPSPPRSEYSSSPHPPQRRYSHNSNNNNQEHDSMEMEESLEENEDTDPSLWTIHKSHTTTHATTSNHTNTTPESPSNPALLSPVYNRKRSFDDDSNSSSQHGWFF